MTVASFDPRYHDWAEAVELHAWLETQHRILVELHHRADERAKVVRPPTKRTRPCPECKAPVAAVRKHALCGVCAEHKRIIRERIRKQRERDAKRAAA